MSNRRNISLPPELDEKLSQSHINASGLIQELLWSYFAYGDVGEAAEAIAEKHQADRTEQLEDACSTLAGIKETSGDLDRTNPAVMNWSGKLEMPPETLLEHVEEYRDSGGIDV